MNQKLRSLTLSAIMASLVFVTTFFVHIPIPGTESGYLNVGDVVVYLAAVIPGGWYGIAASALGSVIADIASGSVIYAPATFLIKGLMTFITWVIVSKKKRTGSFLIGCILSGLIMVLGYFIYELAVFGIAYALVGIPYNLIQYVCGVVAAIVLFVFLRKLPINRFISIDIRNKK